MLIDKEIVIGVTHKIVSTNPEDFYAHDKFIKFIDNPETKSYGRWEWSNGYNTALVSMRIELEKLPSAEPEDYTEMKREFIRMAEYIDMFLECSDEQKETLIGFISRLAEFMPWTERD